MTTDTDALLQTVREAIEVCAHMQRRRDGYAALDSLAAELERRDHTLELMESGREALASRNAELVAEVERVKAERDDFQRAGQDYMASTQKALSALGKFTDDEWWAGARFDIGVAKSYARATIAEIEGDK